MTSTQSPRIRGPLAAAALAVLAALATAGFAEPPRIVRISTENAASHFQSIALERFADALSERLGPEYRVEFHADGTLYRDVDAIGALARGELEFAAPGIWQLDRYVPDVAVLMLPSTYARGRDVARGLVDGVLGDALSAEIEGTLGAAVVGDWLDLGYANLFGVAAPIRSVEDIRGKLIRVAAGRANEERIRSLGGVPVIIPYNDLPAYLERGLVDGVLTTYESVDAASLDAYGIRSVLEDEEYYPFYVPLVSGALWTELDDERRSIFASCWADTVVLARRLSERSQDAAKSRLVGRGLAVYRPSDEEAALTRGRLVEREDNMARLLNVSADALDLLRAGLAASGER